MAKALFRFFASLKLAVFSILLLAAVLGVATFLERDYGMRAVHLMVYGTPWFGGVLCLLGVNVFCAAMSRYPWKARQTGFVVTHLGIIILLVGSFMTQQWGVDGSLPIVEKSESRDVLLGDMVLALYDENQRLRGEFPVPETGKKAEGDLMRISLGNNDTLVVDTFLPRLITKKEFVPSPLGQVGIPAIHVALKSSRFNLDQWLRQQHPEAPAEANFGPAIMTFRGVADDAALAKFLSSSPNKSDGRAVSSQSTGYIQVTSAGRQFRFSVEDALKGWQKLAGTAFEIKADEYLPFAVVEKNKLVSRSKEPKNPAVQLLARNSEGVSEKHVIFANYPEFNTLYHAKQLDHPPFGLEFRLVVKAADEAQELSIVGKKRGRLEFAFSRASGRLVYRTFAASGELKGSGDVKVGDTYATGWMDSTFQITQWQPASIEVETPKYVEYMTGPSSAFMSGLRYRIESDRKPAAETLPPKWLYDGGVEPITVGNEMWLLQYSKKKLRLPFAVHLEKFEVGHDPGTTKAASYQSSVIVNDEKNGVQQKSLIYMNFPLDYGGYTLYQASYQLEEGKPPVSVLSVNWDPGRRVKYAGSLVMVLGIFLMFYMNPHYWDKFLGRK